MEKKLGRKGIRWGFVIGLACFITLSYNALNPYIENDDGEWHVVFTMSSARAEADAGSSGWLATFLYNQSEDPDKMDNGTWFESASNVTGYITNDDGQDEVASESGAYFVVRVKFDKDQCYDGDDSQWVHTRTKCHATFTGLMNGDDFSDEPGTHALYANSVANDSTGTNLYINFYWDQGGTGYMIPDDTRCPWNITVYAKY